MQIDHQNATVHITATGDGRREIRVEPRPGFYVAGPGWTTAYPEDLIRLILEVKGPGWLCDEIRRDEDPLEVESDLRESIFNYVPRGAFTDRRLLDFGCGCGASTVILSRLFPDTRITGVELDPALLEIARRRAAYHRAGNIDLLLSPDGDSLPPDLGDFDYIYLSAVYEHLLPDERRRVMPLLWKALRPGGVIFINQTPDRRFPVELHTSGLPLVNYLPDRMAMALVNRFSRKSGGAKSWETLLRNGLRGGTPGGIARDLGYGGTAAPIVLQPVNGWMANQAAIWYLASRTRHQMRWHGWRKRLGFGIVDLITALRIPVAPYLSLAIRKPAGD